MIAASKRVLRSLVPVICPPEAADLADDIVEHVALTIDASGSILRRAFDAGLAAYDVGALPRYLRRAHNLSPEQAEKYYTSWEHGITPMHRELAKALNQLISMSCYSQPKMMEAAGVDYHPAPWIAEVTKKRLTVFADDIKKQDDRILAPDPLRPAVRKKEVA
jgi:hypothetical protein